MPRKPSLDALRIFAVAARHLSFTEAAAELNLTQSAVSHRIRCLEEELGLSLFRRLTRRLELTPQGASLALRVEHAIDAIDRSIVDLSKTDDCSLLKVTMTPSVASHWLIPRLARIRQCHPEVDVQLIADRRLLDLCSEGIDLAVRFGCTPSSNYHAVRLMSDRVIPVCAPDLIHGHGPVDNVDALLSLPLLHDSATEGDGSRTDWQSWLEYCGKPNVVCQDGQHFSDASMLINAAVLGLGIALARVSLVADHLVSGALACPLPLPAPTAYSYYLLGLPEDAERPKIAAFRKVLIDEGARTETFGLTLGMPRPDWA